MKTTTSYKLEPETIQSINELSKKLEINKGDLIALLIESTNDKIYSEMIVNKLLVKIQELRNKNLQS